MSNSAFNPGQLNIIGPGVTTSAFSAGPPTSPSDGDIWIASAVNGTDGTRWQFQYNAGSASAYKWEFIGGSPVVFQGATQSTITTSVQTVLTVGTFTAARAGDYAFPSSGAYGAYPNTIPNSTVEISIGVNGAASVATAIRSYSAPPSNFDWNLAGQPCVITGNAANTVFSIMGFQNGAGYTWSAAGFSCLPKRVS